MSGKFSLFLRLALLSCTSIILFSAVKITPEELSIKKARASTGFLSPLLEIPIAGDDTATVDEAGTITMLDGGATSVLANDTISSGTTIVDTNQTVPPAHGSLNLNANGTFSYTHDGSE
ncbi:MAG: Ig-like domain-containing protein, partial [Anaerolineales bacterium]